MASNKKYWKSVEESIQNNAIVETWSKMNLLNPFYGMRFGGQDTLALPSTTCRD